MANQSGDNGTAVWCYDFVEAEFLCGRQGTLLPASESIRCQVCGVGSFEDLADEVGEVAGTVYWGPNMLDGEIDESLLEGYDIWLVDACGEQSEHLGRVLRSDAEPSSFCCDSTAYNYTFGVVQMPQEP